MVEQSGGTLAVRVTLFRKKMAPKLAACTNGSYGVARK
jgi:hypothetical protein